MMDEPFDINTLRRGPWDDEAMKTVELEEIAPYMNETPICEQTFIDCGFERIDVPEEESGGDKFHYYTYDFGATYEPSLISEMDFTGVQLFNEEYKTWHTEGELQLLFMLFLKDGATK